MKYTQSISILEMSLNGVLTWQSFAHPAGSNSEALMLVVEFQTADFYKSKVHVPH